MTAILGYARVSTEGQDLAGQRKRLQEAGAARVFEDTISGSRFTRPGLDALLDYARPGDTVAVVRLDRLGRSLRELLDLVEQLRARGLALYSLEERIDTNGPGGELTLHLFGALAQFERSLISARTRDGLAAARARGVHTGRPPRDPRKVEAALILIDGGMSPTAAAQTVGLGRSTIYEVLQERQRGQLGATGPEPDAEAETPAEIRPD